MARGKVISVGQPKDGTIAAEVLVDAMAKGELDKAELVKGNLQIHYMAPTPMDIPASLTVGDYGLFFLKKAIRV